MIACGCQEVAWLLPSADTGPLHHPRYPPGCEIDGPKHAVASPEVVGGVLSSRDIAVPCVGGSVPSWWAAPIIERDRMR